MKTVLAIIGAAVLFLYMSASLGIGHFVFTYGPKPHDCTKELS